METKSAIIERNVEISARDGVILRADVYRPADDRQHPVLLGRTCYGKSSWGAWIEPARTAAEEGYVVVINDTRGGFASDGEFRPFFYDIDDGYDVVEWCGTQPWSNGKVGMFGFSAPGFVQLLAAIAQPPHLVAIAPMQTWSSFKRGCVYAPGGAFLGSTLWWGLHQACIDPVRRLGGDQPGFAERHDAAVRSMSELSRWATHHPLEEIPGLPKEFTYFFHDWLAHPDADESWSALDVDAQYASITVPALHLVGWFDMFAHGTGRNYRGISDQGGSSDARRHQRIVFGPWPHGVPVQTVTGHGYYGPNGSVDVREMVLQWYDHWLKGLDTELVAQPAVRMFMLGENSWRDVDDWPPPQARYDVYYLHSAGDAEQPRGGDLDTVEPADEPADTYRYDPADPAPSLTTAIVGVPASATDASARRDVLTFRTAPLAEPLEIAGPITVRLWAATSAADTDWVARIGDLAPDGSYRALSEGMIKARYRRSQSEPKPVPPGAALEYVIELVPVANRFQIGHRVQLDVTSSAAPLYYPNLNTGGGPNEGGTGIRANQLVFHDRDRPSHVVLPVLPSM